VKKRTAVVPAALTFGIYLAAAASGGEDNPIVPTGAKLEQVHTRQAEKTKVSGPALSKTRRAGGVSPLIAYRQQGAYAPRSPTEQSFSTEHVRPLFLLFVLSSCRGSVAARAELLSAESRSP